MSDRAVLHEAIREAADPMAILDRIVRHSLQLVVHADGASLEVRRDAETLEYVSAAGTLEPYIGLCLPVHQSLSGAAVLTGEVQRCDDGLNDPRVNADAVRRTGVVSMLCVPLSTEQGGVAVLKVSSRKANAFDAEDTERLRILARFLDVTVSAASDLAQVTADVLSEIDEGSLSEGEVDRADTARFVANVMTPGLVDVVEASADIREILDSGAIRMVVQPIVDLRSRDLVSCEALARFPGRDDRPPDAWFAAAHQAGLGDEFELMALRTALRTLEDLPRHVHLAVNIGPHAVGLPSFAEICAEAPLDRLTFELTEHQEVADYDEVISIMRDLRARGARLSVDDTGSGYSGLTHILRLSPDVIKLDRELVTSIDRDPAKRALTAGLVVFARSVEAVVVAEGIETEGDARVLSDLGVDFGQGFLFARPMNPSELSRQASAPA